MGRGDCTLRRFRIRLKQTCNSKRHRLKRYCMFGVQPELGIQLMGNIQLMGDGNKITAI